MLESSVLGSNNPPTSADEEYRLAYSNYLIDVVAKILKVSAYQIMAPLVVADEQAKQKFMEEYDRLKEKGGVGEILCHVFDIEGNLIEDSFNKRLVSISFENLKKIPIRVGVAYGKEKRQAILGALRAGIVNVLITDMQAAEYLMDVEQ